MELQIVWRVRLSWILFADLSGRLNARMNVRSLERTVRSFHGLADVRDQGLARFQLHHLSFDDGHAPGVQHET